MLFNRSFKNTGNEDCPQVPHKIQPALADRKSYYILAQRRCENKTEATSRQETEDKRGVEKRRAAEEYKRGRETRKGKRYQRRDKKKIRQEERVEKDDEEKGRHERNRGWEQKLRENARTM